MYKYREITELANNKKAPKKAQAKSRVAGSSLSKTSQKLFTRQGAFVAAGILIIVGLIAVVSTFAATSGGNQRPQSNIKCVRDTTGKCHRYWERPASCPIFASPRITKFVGVKFWNMNTWDTRRAVCKKKYVRYSPGKPNVGGTIR